LIDDNRDHAKILQWAFQQTGKSSQIRYFEDGSLALEYLESKSIKHSDIPDLIFLDFNLPRVDGREVLRKLKVGENTKSIPVIVLSSSEREEDIRKAYELGASSYLSKSVILEEFSSVLQVIQEYWSRIAKLPTRK
jgi:CheY-like chemotaxis protein